MSWRALKGAYQILCHSVRFTSVVVETPPEKDVSSRQDWDMSFVTLHRARLTEHRCLAAATLAPRDSRSEQKQERIWNCCLPNACLKLFAAGCAALASTNRGNEEDHRSGYKYSRPSVGTWTLTVISGSHQSGDC